MTDLRLDRVTVPTAPLGADNPLPPLFGSGNRDYTVDMSEAPDEIRANAGYGRVASIAPYLMQDDYGRERELMEHPVAVLENEVLRATFLLNAGGRLWSLIHRPTGRELLFRNDVLQPANLALRNAWFAGGVEWNVGTIGHTPGTFAPIHAGRVEHPDGTPVLRLWEFDRIRGTVYQIDAHLPTGSAALYINVRITNSTSSDVPSYWWSNIAVPQTDGTRVITCADRAWNYGYSDRLASVPIVDAQSGTDASYPGRSGDAADYFFDTQDARTPWIAAIDEQGTGLGQVSTRQLRGRKLFLWGRRAGGERWQEWLCGEGQSYIEIQAGLARTQFEHVRVPAKGHLSWVEAYGRVDVDAERAHGDWTDARSAAAGAIENLASERALEQELTDGARTSRLPVDEILHAGSGWGSLEGTREGSRAGGEIDELATPFPRSTITEMEADWLELLRSGRFPHTDPTTFPRSMQIDPVWEDHLAAGSGWVEPALLGGLLAARDDLVGARARWLESVGVQPNVLALRNLGALALHLDEHDSALEWYGRALALAPAVRPLVIEALRAFVTAGATERALEVIDGLKGPIRWNSRIRLLEARAAVATGDLSRCGAILDGGLEVSDLREGDNSLTELWWDYQTALRARDNGEPVTSRLRSTVVDTLTVPREFDFRMVRTERSDLPEIARV
ncbi:DUF5107 domain-containing protein [Leifsonia sp. NPDC058230]|uniref:DUF5107 domain-containing protein n=1 Tax=Leifsonia sp. NPDC058230 TaxID=3346391 RepID=UPI0036DD44B5